MELNPVLLTLMATLMDQLSATLMEHLTGQATDAQVLASLAKLSENLGIALDAAKVE